jgi:hypothetical protein
MPTDVVHALDDDNQIAPTNYAALDDADAVPYLRERGREQYKVFLSKPFPRAFAVSASGAWSWAEDGDDPVAQVLATCQKNSREPCKLYAVDNHVVYSEAPPVMASTTSAPAVPATAAAPASAATPASTTKLTGR